MAVTQTIFDPTTQRSKYITIDVSFAMIQQDEDADMDFYTTLTTSAKNKHNITIPVETIRSLVDMVIGGVGGTKRDRITPGPYTDLTDAVQDYILYMVEGDILDPLSAMDFSS